MMKRDFKTGLVTGLVIAVAATVWLCTRSEFSVARRLNLVVRDSSAEQQPPNPEPVLTDIPPKTAKAKTSPPDVRIHIVQRNETLSAISAKYYGSPKYWQRIAAANDAIVKNPDRLTPGTRLIIPEL